MVSTRNHPSNFPPPTFSPSKAVTRTPSRKTVWAHTPSKLTLIWLLIEIPLVIWDFCYMSLRPHSMTGGKWHSPIWTPYSIYARVDYVYGFPALERGDGWPMAQSALNVVETAMYIAYLFLVYKYGVSSAKKGRGAPAKSRVGWLAESREVKGELGGIAALLGFSVAVMTLSKTVIYWAIEYYSGWANIGHNNLFDLTVYFLLPQAPWLIFPTYMAYNFWNEIAEGLTIAARRSVATSSDDVFDKHE
ncbi:MAG: hypothetical protein M1824_000341 [Vezdaea acicularis]|nr:MAG: hypothetical protein M1824_000341 [Vezdaea acicularis]